MKPILSNTLSPNQFFFMIVQTQIGIAILTLPYVVFESAQWEGWISVLVAGATIQLVLLFLISVAHRFKNYTFFSMIESIFGKFLSKIITFLYFYYFIIVCILVCVLYYRTIDAWLFPETPKWVIMILVILAAIYLVRENIDVIARFYVFVSGLIVFIIVVQFSAYPSANPLYLLPLGHASLKDHLVGAEQSIQAMLGFEIVFFLYPVIQGTKKQITKVSSLAIWFTTILYTFTILSTYMFFSPDEIGLIPNPVLYMLKAYSSPFIDRLDLVFISVWIISVTTSIMTYLYLASQCTKALIPSMKRKTAVPLLGGIILLCGLQFESNDAIQKFSEFVSYNSYIFVVGFPLLFFLIALIRKKPFRREGSST